MITFKPHIIFLPENKHLQNGKYESMTISLPVGFQSRNMIIIIFFLETLSELT